MNTPTPPTERDRSRAAQMIAYADGELELRDAIAQAITDARAEGRREGLSSAASRLRLWSCTLESIGADQ